MNRSSTAKSKRYTVNVDEKTYKLIQRYSEKTRVPISKVVGGALAEWLIVCGSTHLDRIEALAQGANKVVSIDAGGENEVLTTESVHATYSGRLS